MVVVELLLELEEELLLDELELLLNTTLKKEVVVFVIKLAESLT